MKTSNYGRSGYSSKAISIAARCPDWYKGKTYKKLAPKHSFFKRYKLDKNEEAYTKSYYEEVLNKLNPKEVYEDLGEDAILLCWEGAGKFCHRRIVAKWLEDSLGIKIEEV